MVTDISDITDVTDVTDASGISRSDSLAGGNVENVEININNVHSVEAVLANIVDNGHICEVQLIHNKMWKKRIKAGVLAGHTNYKITRSIKANVTKFETKVGLKKLQPISKIYQGGEKVTNKLYASLFIPKNE